MITVIAAMDKGRGIGFKGKIPWHIPEELFFFRKETMGGAVIMGRKTYESLEHKPLKYRLNIVVTSTPEAFEEDEVITVGSWNQAKYTAMEAGYSRIYAIGGAKIYEEALQQADRIMLTRIHQQYEADTFFPWFDRHRWLQKDSYNLHELATATEYLRIT